MLGTLSATNGSGPAIRALDPWQASDGRMRQLLVEEERVRLAAVATVVRFKKGEVIYREGDVADAVFNIISGVVTPFRKGADGAEHMVAFLLADDLFGLAAERRYTNSVKAITPVVAYRLPVAALRGGLLQDAQFEFHIICKLCQELRQVQRHAFLLSQRRAATRLAMFLRQLEQLEFARGDDTAEIYVPMDRSDVAEYVGMTLPAVSRAFAALTARGVIAFRNRGHVKVLDRAAFDKLSGDDVEPRSRRLRRPH